MKKDLNIVEIENDDIVLQMEGNVVTWAELNGKPESNKALIALLTKLLEMKLDKELREAGTHTKITYDEYGLVVNGEELSIEDLPDLYLENIKDVEATAEEVNKLHGLKASKEEIDKLYNLSTTRAELEILHGLKTSTAELNKLKGLLVASAQLNMLDGIKDNVQKQLDSKMGNVDFEIENQANKTNNWNTTSTTTYPSSKALKDGLDTKQGKLTDEQLSRLNNAIKVQDLDDLVSGKLDANEPIEPGTACKVQYDEKGLIVGSEKLLESDIPSLHLKKISDIRTSASDINRLQGLQVEAEQLNSLAGIEGNVQEQLDAITEVIPAEATKNNLLTDRKYVRNAIYNFAGFYLTKDANNTPFATMEELLNTYQFYDNREVKPLAEHDYVVVVSDETHDEATVMYCWDKDDIYTEGHWRFQYIINNEEVLLRIINNVLSALNNHKADKNNPHNVTKEQLGLGNVDNTSDLNKPISTAQGLVNAQVHQHFSTIETDLEDHEERIGSAEDDIEAVSNRVTTIEGKVPNLATKQFVTDTVSSESATFRGNYNSVEELNAYSGEKDNNDYAWVSVTVDGNKYYDRYKYNGTTWSYEYRISNVSFESGQWETINSGLTSSDVEQIGENADNIASIQDTLDGLGTIATHGENDYLAMSKVHFVTETPANPQEGHIYFVVEE